MSTHREVTTLHLALINIPEEVLAESSARFKYGVLKNTNSTNAQIKEFTQIYSERINDMFKLISTEDEKIYAKLTDEEKEKTKPDIYSIQGLYTVKLKCGSENPELNKVITQVTTDHKELLKELDDFLKNTENDFKPYKIKLSEIPNTLHMSFIQSLDILIEED